MLAVLESANIPVKPCTPTLLASAAEKQRIRAWLKENKLIENNFIIIHAGGSKQHPEKRWPYYEQLATKLSSMDKTIVWIGGDDDIKLNKKTVLDRRNKRKQHVYFLRTGRAGPTRFLRDRK